LTRKEVSTSTNGIKSNGKKIDFIKIKPSSKRKDSKSEASLKTETQLMLYRRRDNTSKDRPSIRKDTMRREPLSCKEKP
jgi:hypothetical protein